jgi:hypothetical protein
MATQDTAVAGPIEPHEKVGEKRQARRSLVIKKAMLVFNGGHCSMDCQVLDLSKTGARLKPDDILVCPEQFTLKFPHGSVHLCEVRWRKGNILGVRFLSPLD